MALSGGLELGRPVLVAPFAASADFVDRFAEGGDLPPEARDRMRENIERRFRMRFDDRYVPVVARSLHTPALVIHDLDDEDIPFAEGEAIARAWPR